MWSIKSTHSCKVQIQNRWIERSWTTNNSKQLPLTPLWHQIGRSHHAGNIICNLLVRLEKALSLCNVSIHLIPELQPLRGKSVISRRQLESVVTGRRFKRAVSISIYSDRQSFIKSTSTRAMGSGQCLINEFHSAADNFPGQLNLRWISGHSNVLTGNERADELAKQAAQEHSSPTPDLPSLLR